MPTAAATRGAFAWSCWKRKRWRRRRAWTSAPTGRNAACASPTRVPGRSSRKRRSGSDCSLLPGDLPELVEARLLGEHLRRVLRGRLVERAGVHLQRGLGVAEAALVLAQDARADQDVHFRLEQRRLAAVRRQLVEVE